MIISWATGYISQPLCETAGARLESPISTHEWGRLALMADPFGHGFCFVQFLGRGNDGIADP
jgi:hypothetical protein